MLWSAPMVHGKTTLMLMCNGVLEPSKGRVLLDGKPLAYDSRSLREVRKKVGMVFQNSDMQLFAPTVYQDVAFGPLNLGMTQEEIQSAVARSLAAVRAIGDLGNYYHNRAEEGRAAQVVPVLGAEEANLRHALSLARIGELWDAAIGCLQGLRVLYARTGRDGEWARVVADVTPDFTEPVTGGPLPGRGDQWNLVTEYRSLAAEARDWATCRHCSKRQDRLAAGPGRRCAGRICCQPHPGSPNPDP